MITYIQISVKFRFPTLYILHHSAKKKSDLHFSGDIPVEPQLWDDYDKSNDFCPHQFPLRNSIISVTYHHIIRDSYIPLYPKINQLYIILYRHEWHVKT